MTPNAADDRPEVRITAKGCEIVSLNEKNPVLVNGQEVETAVLDDGDLVTLGETEVRFEMSTPGENPVQIEALPRLQPALNPQATLIAPTRKWDRRPRCVDLKVSPNKIILSDS